MMHLKAGAAWLFCLFYLPGLRAQEARTPQIHSFSLQQAADYAQQHNVQVVNALLDVQIQKQSNRGITSQALPNLSAEGSYTDYLKIPVTVVPAEFFGGAPGTFAPVQFGTKHNASGAVNLRQVLFDGQVFVGLQARKTSIDLLTTQAALTEENIRANVYKIYYQLVVSKTQIAQIDANIELLQKFANDTRIMHENGFAEELDANRANVQLANIQTEKSKVLNSVANGYLALKVLIGVPAQDSLVLTDPITEDEIKAGALESGIYKYTNRKEFQAMQLTERLNEYDIKRHKMSYIPSLNLNATYSKMAMRTSFDLFGKGEWFTTSYVGLSLSVPIFDGFSRASNIQKAKLTLQQTQNQMATLQLSIDQEVIQARNDFKTAILTIDFQKANTGLAEKAYQQTKKKFESGLASTTDVTTAQTDLRTAQSNYISALYDAVIARVNYLKATGQLK
ncbi:TolC family protein [Filimonas effusa]|uniref:TolC family protein n=1 Tax=Filimonas effusa TaxID=2508721 RepID=A0A4V1M9P9_9BACT|nr:TolC family protein [Filimonas effusa]RXK81970.1 TolC family protein [Filimonas effusa]